MFENVIIVSSLMSETGIPKNCVSIDDTVEPSHSLTLRQLFRQRNRLKFNVVITRTTNDCEKLQIGKYSNNVYQNHRLCVLIASRPTKSVHGSIVNARSYVIAAKVSLYTFNERSISGNWQPIVWLNVFPIAIIV